MSINSLFIKISEIIVNTQKFVLLTLVHNKKFMKSVKFIDQG